MSISGNVIVSMKVIVSICVNLFIYLCISTLPIIN